MGTINLKIAELRKARGLTQQELGDILSVSYQTVSKWENEVTLPDITILPTLADFFRCRWMPCLAWFRWMTNIIPPIPTKANTGKAGFIISRKNEKDIGMRIMSNF